MTEPLNIDCDLVIIGAGMAGMAASLFAGNKNIETVQVGITSEIIFASGLLDLMGVHPVEHETIRKDPWEGIEALCRDIPDHPYAKIPPTIIHKAFEELIMFLNASGLVYVRHENQNALVLTPVGTAKPSYFIPITMWNGVQALQTKEPCLIVDIEGLKGFSARQIVASFRSRWPGLDHATISFPGSTHQGEVYLEPLARSLVIPQTRKALADELRPHLKDARFLGMPAVFGIQDSHKILSDIENQVGVPIFEIPTMPPSIPGLRLKEAFESNLPAKGVRRFFQKRVMTVQTEGKGFVVQIGDTSPETLIKTRGIVLASGRFLGKGLSADRKQIRESIFDLPVHQPDKRNEWHCYEFLDPAGHPVNRAGILTDDRFRPLDRSDKPAHKGLFAAGSILAHQDWMRQKCGSGLAIATAYAAVNAFLDYNAS
ncbi:glycerol-3-phosphate dehydrogenase subunit GlpB [Thermodesulfobacteriota bacterium]